jgi:hypothetical protein
MSSLFAFLSKRGNQSATCSLLGLTGTPKYLIRNLAIKDFSIGGNHIIKIINPHNLTLVKVDFEAYHHLI